MPTVCTVGHKNDPGALWRAAGWGSIGAITQATLWHISTNKRHLGDTSGKIPLSCPCDSTLRYTSRRRMGLILKLASCWLFYKWLRKSGVQTYGTGREWCLGLISYDFCLFVGSNQYLSGQGLVSPGSYFFTFFRCYPMYPFVAQTSIGIWTGGSAEPSPQNLSPCSWRSSLAQCVTAAPHRQ